VIDFVKKIQGRHLANSECLPVKVQLYKFLNKKMTLLMKVRFLVKVQLYKFLNAKRVKKNKTDDVG